LIRAIRVLVLSTLLAGLGCGSDRDDSLVDAYDRMMASAEQRAAEDAARGDEITTVPPDQAAAPGPEPAAEALPIDTLPAAAAEPPAPVAPTPDTVQRAFEGTLGAEQQRRAGAGASVLRAVRTAEHDDFDRIVFEFEGSLPGYQVEYVNRPIRECGSGREISVPGSAWLRIRLDPARAHEMVGDFAQVTVASRNRALDHEVVQQLVLTCDHEAQVEWVAGVTVRNEYRLLQFTEPSRLVIDVLH
jgi:hypothetical protein